MLILQKKETTEKALHELASVFEKAFESLRKVRKWDFPDGSETKVPTWLLSAKKNPILLGFDPKKRWRSKSEENPDKLRCPILLTPMSDSEVLTPLVEVNIPEEVDKNVQGCFALDEERRLWLCHRGTRLTVSRTDKIPSRTIHRYFKKREELKRAVDIDFKKTDKQNHCIKVIKVAEVEPTRIEQSLLRFFEHIKKLKGWE